MDARGRYELAKALANEPSEANARRLVAMLSDDGTYELDDGVAMFEADPTVVKVTDAAWGSLATMVDTVWPVIVEALRGATTQTVGAMVSALDRMTPELRSTLPERVHDAIVEAARRSSVTSHRLEAVTWERDFARRVRTKELVGPEAFWRARLEHPDWTARTLATQRLSGIVQDEEAYALELVARLSKTDPDQPTVDELSKLPITPAVAEAARPLIAGCVDMLRHTPVGDYIPWQPTRSDDDLRWRFAASVLRAFAAHAPWVRFGLVDRLLATNEVPSIHGSLRSRLIEALGDPARLHAEIQPRIEGLEASADVVEVNRGSQLRAAIAAAVSEQERIASRGGPHTSA